jgi:hypothetical protein
MKNTLSLLGFIAVLTGGCQMHSSGPDFNPGLSHMDIAINTSNVSITGDVYNESDVITGVPVPGVTEGVEVGTSERVSLGVNYGILVDRHLEIGGTFGYASDKISTNFHYEDHGTTGTPYRVQDESGSDLSEADLATSISFGGYTRYYFGHQGPMHHWVQGDVGYHIFDFFSSLDGPDYTAIDPSGLYGGVSAGVTYFLTESAAFEMSGGIISVFGTDSMTDVSVQGGISVFN